MPGAPRRPAGGTPATLYLGTVSKVTGATALVVIPELGGPSYTYGPARFPSELLDRNAGAAGTTSTGATSDGDPLHTHTYGDPLKAGDPVLVGLLATRTGTRDAVVIVARLA